MFEWWKVIILGAVEGFTEFLPISSTGHLLIVGKLLNFTQDAGGTFEIFIQLGATLAIFGYYWQQLWAQARAIPTDSSVRRFWFHIAVAAFPAAVIGLLIHDWIKAVLFESPALIAWALIIGGVILIVVERLPKRVTTHDATQITFRQALSIGLAQVAALIPGVSRSGATIVGALLAGVDRPAATGFSFYLAIPMLISATVYDLLKNLDQLTQDDISRLALGLVVALITAWISIGWLLRYVANHTFVSFGIYRILIGALVLVLSGMGIL